MKNNLLKSVATVATASALLFSTVTSFAATATTVTTYKEGGKVGVTSTIKDAEVGKMITYLASYNADGTVKESGDIAYIGQKTVPSNGVVTFSYDISKSGVTAGDVIAKVRYGSDDSATATALNKDATSKVKYGELSVVSNNCTVSPTYIGNGDKVSVTVTPEAGYEVKTVSINGKEFSDTTATTYEVEYADDMEIVVVCGLASNENTRVISVGSIEGEKQVGIVCHGVGYKTGVTFGAYATLANGTPYEMDNNGGFYAAQVNGDGFYAVQILNDKENYTLPADLKLVPAFETKEGVFDGVTGESISKS